MVRTLTRLLTRDRIETALIWLVLLSVAWSLPVVAFIQTERERALTESGHYYTPKMPAEWYVTRD